MSAPILTDDVFPDETTMIVRKRFHSGPATYTYAVSKIGGEWFISGEQAKGKPYTWDRLLVWMSAGIVVSAKMVAEFSSVLVPVKS
jgi:hypothetical protein